MNTTQALKRLEQAGVTSSLQMLRRWLRQGKIDAVLLSNKEGYQINEQSLEEFIVRKQFLDTEDPLQHQLAYKQGYQAGVVAGRKEATQQALEKIGRAHV